MDKTPRSSFCSKSLHGFSCFFSHQSVVVNGDGCLKSNHLRVSGCQNREGNGWSYAYCRRQWSLADAEHLRYRFLNAWDAALQALDEEYSFLSAQHQIVSYAGDPEQAGLPCCCPIDLTCAQAGNGASTLRHTSPLWLEPMHIVDSFPSLVPACLCTHKAGMFTAVTGVYRIVSLFNV